MKHISGLVPRSAWSTHNIKIDDRRMHLCGPYDISWAFLLLRTVRPDSPKDIAQRLNESAIPLVLNTKYIVMRGRERLRKGPVTTSLHDVQAVGGSTY